MKKIKLLSLLLVATLCIGALTGCGFKKNSNNSKETSVSNIKPEEGHVVPVVEDTIIPEFVSKQYTKDYQTIIDDYKLADDLYDKGGKDEKIIDKYQPFIDKHGYQKLEDSKKFINKDITVDPTIFTDMYQADPDYYKGLSTYLFMKSEDGITIDWVKDRLLWQVKCYTNDVFSVEENSQYTLAEDFAKLKPKEVVQDYLKKNKMEITKVYNPTITHYEKYGAGTVILTVGVPIEGTKNGKQFSETIHYDFHFVLNKELREGGNIFAKNSQTGMIGAIDSFEIMAITSKHYNADTKTYDFK